MNEVNENVTVNGAGTQDEEPAAKNNETKAEKFIRLGEYRMNKAIDAIGRLEHLANRSAYEYTAEQVEAMFGALENKDQSLQTNHRRIPGRERESNGI